MAAGAGGGAAMSPRPSFDDLARWVQEQISPARWEHTLGVVETARRLATRWSVDEEKAAVAAILHDCARELPPAALLNKVDEFGIVRDEVCDAEPMLYHGPVAAQWVRRQWGIDDPDVLEAIAVHTTGVPGMSPVAKVVFAADALEPGRRWPGVDELRQLAFTDLDVALRRIIEGTIGVLIERGRLIHPDSVAARNDLLLRARK